MSYLQVFKSYFEHLKKKHGSKREIKRLIKSMKYWLHVPDDGPLYGRFAEQNPKAAELYESVLQESFKVN